MENNTLATQTTVTALTLDKALVKKLAKVAYPEYKGRKFRVESRKHYGMTDYWDGGSRNYAVAVDLSTGQIVDSDDAAKNPFHGKAHTMFEIPAGVGILEHAFFCGKDCGITLYIP